MGHGYREVSRVFLSEHDWLYLESRRYHLPQGGTYKKVPTCPDLGFRLIPVQMQALPLQLRYLVQMCQMDAGLVQMCQIDAGLAHILPRCVSLAFSVVVHFEA